MSRALHQVPAVRRIQTANSGWYKRRLRGTGVVAWNEGRHNGASRMFLSSVVIMTAPGMEEKIVKVDDARATKHNAGRRRLD